MRQPKAELVDNLVAGENQVDVERPWCVRARTRAAVTPFDLEKRVEQFARGAG
jgi:hypothetical protein